MPTISCRMSFSRSPQVSRNFSGPASPSEPLSEPRPTGNVGSDAPSAATGGEATGTFRGWLGAITRNKLCDFYERRQRQPAAQGGSDVHRLLQEIPAATLSDDATDAAQLSDVYHRAL